MKRKYVFVLAALVVISSNLFAQQGVHGPKIIGAANTIVNEYTAITAFTPAGSTSITVASSTLNANGRFAGNLVPGDLIMLYQAQGTIINGPTASGSDTAWGRVDPGNYFSTGFYEFRQVLSVPNATTIIVDCALSNTYIQNGGTARKPEVIRVPRYTTLTINGGGVLTCDDWNGTIGGVLAVEVQGATVINAGGSVDATGKGFRGGSLVGDNATSFGSNTTWSTNNTLGAEKGESVSGYQSEYDAFGGRYGRGAPANGGGGGCAHNAGGGGGANAPNVNCLFGQYWSGNGIPDQAPPGWTAAWNTEPIVNTMSLRTVTNSQGGGRGGYSFSANDLNATTLGGAPGLVGWGGDFRNHQATGLGGRVMDYSTGRLFLGGGGGAGDQNNLGGGIGGDGGGLIYLMCFGNVTGSGTVVSNGLAGANAAGGTGPSVFGIDGAGGGGAGGTVILNAVGGVANTLTVNTNGGVGGNQVVTGLFSNEAEGPGGGGGGGYIGVSSGSPTRNSNGGNNGTTNSVALTEFTANGATKGCPGTPNATITNFTITTTNITICTGSSVTLTAVLGGTVPGGAVVNWYSASTGGVPIATGTSYTTPVLFANTTYWVGTCPGWWRVPVIVTVGPAPIVTATASPTSICSGGSATLTAGGAITYNWMPGNINGSPIIVSPLVTTTYTVTGTVSIGCTNTATVTVTVNPTPTVTASGSPLTICAGSSTTLTGGGATTYNWNPGNINGSPIVVSPLTTTTYTVTGTSLGCSSTAQVTITVNPSPTVTSTALPATICSGATSTLTGGGAVSYLWNPGAHIGSPWVVSPLVTTTYTVTGTGANGCTSTSQVTVTVNPTPTVTSTALPTTICAGNSTTLTGGGASTYNWNPGNINGSPIVVSPIVTTTYTVTGTAANGCTSTSQVTVTVNPSPTVTSTALPTTICAGSSSTLTGGGALTYNWNPGNINGNPIVVSPIVTTTYTVTGTGANGCTSTSQVTVTVNPTPTVTSSASPSTICSGSSSTLTGGGATTYNWNPGNINGSPIVVSPVVTTTYTVTGTGANGCTSTSQVTVTVNPTPTVTSTALPTTICAGSSTTLTGGGASTYNWNPGNINGSPIVVSPIVTTTYTVTGTGANGCTSTSQVTVTVNPSPTVTSTALPTTICSGNSTTLTGSGAITYNWNPGNINGSPIVVSPIVTTTYTVTGTGVNGCTSTSQVTVTVNPTPTVTSTALPTTICAGGSATLTGGGASTYNWNPGNINGSPIVVTPLSTTTYTVTGTAANGCTSSSQVTVTVNPTPTVTSTASPTTICVGATTTLTGSGATSYNWNPGNITGNPITVSPIVTTTYTVTGTGANGCTSTSQVTVTVNPLPTPTASATPSSICVGQSSVLNSTGGTSYLWNGGTLVNAAGSPQTVSPAVTTTYTVTATDAFGCSANAQLTLIVNPVPTANAGIDQTICEGTLIAVTASGGGTYVWNGGSLVNANGSTQSDTPLITTTYTVTVTNAFGCSNTDSITVNVNALPTVSAGPDVSICPNSSIQLNVSGASTYLWTPSTGLNFNNISNPIASPIVTTTYIVSGTSAAGCTNKDTIIVTISNSLTVTAGADVIICSGDTILLSTSGGTIYSWTPSASLQTPNSASTNAFPASTTTYVVNVTDANNCSGSDTITVFVNGPVALASTGTTTICIGQSASITATPSNGISPYTFNWSNSLTGPGPQNVSPVVTTSYTVSVTDSIGCTSPVQTITITVNPAISIATMPSVGVCPGSSTTLTASASGGDGNFTYLWLPGGMTTNPVTVSPLVTTTYSVIVSDGCGTPADTQTVIVNINTLPTVALQSSNNISCFGLTDGGAQVQVTAGNGPYTYAWSPSGGTSAIVSGLGIGTYTCVVTDANGCTQTQSVSITEPTAIQLTGSSTPDNCLTANGSATVLVSGGTSGYSYVWNNSDTTSTTNNLSSGTYTVTVTDANGCVSTSTIVVGTSGTAIADAGTSVTISAGQTTVLVGTGGVTYSWSPPADLNCPTCPNPIASPTVTTTYTLTVTDSLGCSATDTVTVYVDADCGDVWLPNAFSPNDDGVNDVLFVRGNCIKYMQFEVYNRWGENVFTSTKPSDGWDGTWRGEKCESAVFTYFLRVTLIDDSQKDLQGNISLVK